MSSDAPVRVPLEAESLPTQASLKTSPLRNSCHTDLLVQDRIREANTRKVEGNDYFRKGDWQEALSAYESAIVFLPKRKIALGDARSDKSSEQNEEGEPSQDTEVSASGLAESAEEVFDTETEKTCTTLRSILNANIGACHVKLVSLRIIQQGFTNQLMRESTSELSKRVPEVRPYSDRVGPHRQFPIALADDPKYLKALQRRATSNEILNTWSSLSSAQEGCCFRCESLSRRLTSVGIDYNTLLELLPSGQEMREVQTKLQKLKPRLEEAQKKETSEMLGKLKTLGNSLLGMVRKGVAVPEANCTRRKFWSLNRQFQVRTQWTGGLLSKLFTIDHVLPVLLLCSSLHCHHALEREFNRYTLGDS